jgi:hypothetical protein
MNPTTRALLANGSFGAFLNALNTTLQYSGSPVGQQGSVLRHAGFPDNYLVPDPQYTSVNVAQQPELDLQLAQPAGHAAVVAWFHEHHDVHLE